MTDGVMNLLTIVYQPTLKLKHCADMKLVPEEDRGMTKHLTIHLEGGMCARAKFHGHSFNKNQLISIHQFYYA